MPTRPDATQPSSHVLRHAADRPDDLAVVGSNAEISYGQLADHASRIAGVLAGHGVRAGDVVGVRVPPQLEVVFIQALFQLAAISCHPPKAFRSTGELRLDWLVSLHPNDAVTPQRTILIDGPWLARAAVAEPAPPTDYAHENDVCRLIFSSGTTGAPKAVPLSVRNLHYRAEVAPTHWMAYPPILCMLDLTTASGTTAFFTSLVLGDTYLIPGSAAESLAILGRMRAASVKGSPAQLDALAREAEAHPVALPELHVIQSVGSLLPEALIPRLAAAFDAEVVNLYGSSESGVLAIRADGSTDPMDAGTIVHDMTVEIVDEDHQPVAEGITGAIRSRRPHQAVGYFRDAEASAEHFRDGWFYPGDLGSLTGGRLRLAGRASELINAGGPKVDPARIDAAAMLFEGLDDAAAFALTDASGVTRVALAIVGTVDVAALSRHLAAELGAARPTVVVQVTAIPRTAMGKARRSELARSVESLRREGRGL